MVLPGGVAVILTVSITLGVGLIFSGAACLTGESALPLVTLGISILATVPLFCCGLLTTAMDETPAYLNSTSVEEDNCMDLGWFIFGGLLFSAFACPMLFASNRILSMTVSWLSTISVWCTLATVLVVALLLLKIHMREQGTGGGDGNDEGGDDDEEDNKYY